MSMHLGNARYSLDAALPSLREISALVATTPEPTSEERADDDRS